MPLLTVDEVIELLIARNILSRTKVYGAHETIKQGSPAFHFVENTDIWPVKEPEFRDFVAKAIENEEAEMNCSCQAEISREGPPNSDDYQWWENNVQYAKGTVKIRLSMKGGEPTLVIGNFSLEKTYWTGY